ncbi:MAG: hypothetical protein C0184_17185 [Chloroflexus aggregans]|uniref:CopZ zinc binding domain-containing protein n=1 Tax=Chloroflexus aggregans TaxID=152260 RepID=A0A2J6WNY5_9CHLR|nr:MAG: hypothetical protein C0184_17185 [Chloroflexus aggregans]
MCTPYGCAVDASAVTGDAKLPQSSAHLCPSCQATGKKVPIQTVRALAAISLRRVTAQEYRFCQTADCPVVYFSNDGSQTLTVDHVRERVFQKEAHQPDVFVCYCFQYQVGDLSGASQVDYEAIVADIKAGIAADQCACDLRNPQGVCCLGNVMRIIRAQENS